jgi:hypothetical protein
VAAEHEVALVVEDAAPQRRVGQRDDVGLLPAGARQRGDLRGGRGRGPQLLARIPLGLFVVAVVLFSLSVLRFC